MSSSIRIILLFLLSVQIGRSPIDRVETVAELVRGCEFPFTDDGPDDDRSSYAGCDDDDGNDGVAGEMTAAAGCCS